MSKIIQSEWLSYKNRVIHEEAGAVQIKETKRAFYVGAAALFNRLSDCNIDSEEDAEKVFNSIHGELNHFLELLEQGKA